MLNVSIGPLTIQVSHLLLGLSLLVAAGVGHLVGRTERVGIVDTLSGMLLVALLAARLVFVLIWFDQYRQAPWSILDIRDGGFERWTGVGVAVLVVLWRSWRVPLLRRPLALGMLAGVLAWSMSGAPGMLGMTSQAPLPTVPLTTLGGTATTLARLSAGKPMVVNLWASWCPPCRREMPVLSAAQQRDAGVTFVFVNQGESAAVAANYLAAESFVLANVVLDGGTLLGKAIGSSALPTTLFYDASGRLVDTHLGALSAASLSSKLQRLHDKDF
ncbi:TlpA disulfide reductase family protein [Actimicrobium antarcticum]|uniref:TlpA disulfide reductase family protein n=1 Tax=Actimicrobium antarcticum TaxID=1051899 RepID=A0ABP7SHJ9_9BURK